MGLLCKVIKKINKKHKNMEDFKKTFFLFLSSELNLISKNDFNILIENYNKIEIEDTEEGIDITFKIFTELNDKIFIPCGYNDNKYIIGDISFLEKLNYFIQRNYLLKLDYHQQLKHELWRKKRLEIIKQRNSKCEKCSSVENLQIHHLKYINKTLAWEYEDSLLQCLCRKCHEKEHNLFNNKPIVEKEKIKKSVFELCVEDSKIILNHKIRILKTLNDVNINYIVNKMEVLRFNSSYIVFRIEDKKHGKFLEKKYPDLIFLNKEMSISFFIQYLKKYKTNKP